MTACRAIIGLVWGSRMNHRLRVSFPVFILSIKCKFALLSYKSNSIPELNLFTFGVTPLTPFFYRSLLYLPEIIFLVHLILTRVRLQGHWEHNKLFMAIYSFVSVDVRFSNRNWREPPKGIMINRRTFTYHLLFLSSLLAPPDWTQDVRGLRWTDLGQVPNGSGRLHLARWLPAVLHLPDTFGSSAVVLFARTTGLLQSGLCQVSEFISAERSRHDGVLWQVKKWPLMLESPGPNRRSRKCSGNALTV